MSRIATATRNVSAGSNSICGHSAAASSSPAAPARYHGERRPTESASHGGQRRACQTTSETQRGRNPAYPRLEERPADVMPGEQLPLTWRGTLGSGPTSSSSPCPSQQSRRSRIATPGPAASPWPVSTRGRSWRSADGATWGCWHATATSRLVITKRPWRPSSPTEPTRGPRGSRPRPVSPRGSSLEVSALIGQNARPSSRLRGRSGSSARVCRHLTVIFFWHAR